jgi:hypothetical protein
MHGWKMNPLPLTPELLATTRLRRAALALHALNEVDRQRVWTRLSGAQHALLSPLLQELVSLGIPKGHQWLSDSEGVLEAAPGVKARAHEPTAKSLIWGLSADQVINLLAGQSLDTAAAIVSADAWPWKPTLLDRWPAEQRHALNERLKNPFQPSARFIEQLLRELSSRGLTRIPTLPSELSRSGSARRPLLSAVMSLFFIA